MAVGDALLTRAVTIATAGTDYPTGLTAPGGAVVDEIDLTGLNRMPGLAAVVYVTAISGTNTLLVVSFEVDQDEAFGSSRVVLPGQNITTVGGKVLGWLPPIPERYGRFKIVSTSDTTAAATVQCRLEMDHDSRRLIPTA